MGDLSERDKVLQQHLDKLPKAKKTSSVNTIEMLKDQVDKAEETLNELQLKLATEQLKAQQASTEKYLKKCYKANSNYYKILAVSEYVAEILVVGKDIRLDSIWVDSFKTRTAKFVEITNEEFENEAKKALNYLLND